MQAGERPEIEAMALDEGAKKRWKASPETEDQVLALLKGVLPIRLRANDKRLEEFYQHGYLFYVTGRYKIAKPYFQMLCFGRPDNTKYQMAVAACSHMLKQYPEAISFYTMILYFDTDNPMPLYHIADCYLKMFQPFGALIALDMAIKKCTNPKHQKLKDRMTLMVSQLEKELKERQEAGAKSFIGPNAA
jgi:type III secretion system low calcium response chaperone LcrH/SycD